MKLITFHYHSFPQIKHNVKVYAESKVSEVMSKEIARALIKISFIYEALNNTEAAHKLLRKAMKSLSGSAGHFNAIAGIEI